MPSTSLFAWQGFSFEHPEDWAPVSLSGDRREGYARLQSGGRVGCQIRWRQAKKSHGFESTLQSYFQLLEKSARKAKVSLHTDVEERAGEGLGYRWRGEGQGRGIIFAGDCSRVFLFEVNGGAADSLLPISKAVLATFRSSGGEALEPWALFGLSVRLPSGLSPSAKLLQAGRTWLTFRPRGAVIEAGRFGFGHELAQKHGLENWAKAALNLPKSAGKLLDESRLELSRPSKALHRGVFALVHLDAERNQLVCVRCSSRQARWKPDWNWLPRAQI